MHNPKAGSSNVDLGFTIAKENILFFLIVRKLTLLLDWSVLGKNKEQ